MDQETPVQITVEQARLALEAETQERAQRCLSRINAILAEEKCRLDVAFVLTQQGNFPKIQVIPNN